MKKLFKAIALACVLSMATVSAMAKVSPASQEDSSSDDDGGSSSSSKATTATVAGVTEKTVTTTTVLANGQTAAVVGAIIAADGSVTGGLIYNGTSSAATGEAKRAGLPDTVVSTLNAIDAGNLSSIPAAAGKTVLAQTIAITHVAPGAQQQLIMAVNKIPASGTVQVLYYDNTTGKFIILSAVVDPATGIVTFAAPADGTAAIIG